MNPHIPEKGKLLIFRKRYFAELKGSSSGVAEPPPGKRALPVVEASRIAS